MSEQQSTIRSVYLKTMQNLNVKHTRVRCTFIFLNELGRQYDWNPSDQEVVDFPYTTLPNLEFTQRQALRLQDALYPVVALEKKMARWVVGFQELLPTLSLPEQHLLQRRLTVIFWFDYPSISLHFDRPLSHVS
ncbi:hypothetical protein ACFYKX_10250 [Cytobacillus sp. FJAT-54145]|uniref:Uncharacterized protein n=1 Tax=Cytobacillus spartinae TaxID=3299023 RepID=A0ABW6KDM2_9BACI